MENATIKLNHLGRFYIEHPQRRHLAWSGSQWVPHFNGLPTKVQICNFSTLTDAMDYCRQHGLRVD